MELPPYVVSFELDTNTNSLKVASANDSDDRNKEFMCKICFKTYAKKTYLRQHIKRMHMEVRLVQCHICEKFYKNNDYLFQHIRQVHTTQQSIQCVLCNVSYKTNKTFKEHLKKKHMI